MELPMHDAKLPLCFGSFPGPYIGEAQQARELRVHEITRHRPET